MSVRRIAGAVADSVDIGDRRASAGPTRRRWLTTCLAGLLAGGWPEAHAALAPPAGDVMLTVDGAIDRPNAGGEARFDRELLRSLGLTRLRTRTPWTEGVAEFEGVLGRTLLQAAGANGTHVLATARNDFVASIPMDDFTSYDVLLAMNMDGRRLLLRDKGPLWIVYPWSQRPELDTPAIRSRSVWQLVQLTVR